MVKFFRLFSRRELYVCSWNLTVFTIPIIKLGTLFLVILNMSYLNEVTGSILSTFFQEGCPKCDCRYFFPKLCQHYYDFNIRDMLTRIIGPRMLHINFDLSRLLLVSLKRYVRRNYFDCICPVAVKWMRTRCKMPYSAPKIR